MIKRDDAYKAVVKFSTPIIENGQSVTSVGTGFFLAKDECHLFLITANHVIKKFNTNTVVSMAGTNKNGARIQIVQVKMRIPYYKFYGTM